MYMCAQVMYKRKNTNQLQELKIDRTIHKRFSEQTLEIKEQWRFQILLVEPRSATLIQNIEAWGEKMRRIS